MIHFGRGNPVTPEVRQVAAFGHQNSVLIHVPLLRWFPIDNYRPGGPPKPTQNMFEAGNSVQNLANS